MMKKNTKIARSAATGRFVTKPIGGDKATKFAAVEGMTLSKRSKKSLKDLQAQGLSGDALRSAIIGKFKAS